MKPVAALLILLTFCLPTDVGADDVPAEIEFLLQAVGNSDCVFIRNGKRHAANDAEDHLRMKYRRARRYAPTTELFIERLASKSSMSKKLYHIDCPDEELVPSGEWLTRRLLEYRARHEAVDDGK